MSAEQQLREALVGAEDYYKGFPDDAPNDHLRLLAAVGRLLDPIPAGLMKVLHPFEVPLVEAYRAWLIGGSGE